MLMPLRLASFNGANIGLIVAIRTPASLSTPRRSVRPFPRANLVIAASTSTRHVAMAHSALGLDVRFLMHDEVLSHV